MLVAFFLFLFSIPWCWCLLSFSASLIISCLGSLREMIKRKERRRKRSRKSRRRRRSFSRWFLFSPPSSFPLLCLKNIAGRFGHKKNLRKSCNRLQNFVYLHQYEIEKHFPGIRLPCRSGEQGGRSEPMWLILSCEMIDIGSHNG